MPHGLDDIEEIAYLETYSSTDWSLVFKRELIMNKVPLGAHCVLDCGCGAGHLAHELLERHMEVVTFDIDAEALRRTRRRFAGALVRGSALAIPFRSEVFDVVILSDLLEHVVDDKRVLREIRIVLRRAGRLILTGPGMRVLWSQHDVRLGHVRRYGKEELCSKVQSVGFTVIDAYFWASLFFPVAFLVRKLGLVDSRSGGVTSRRQRRLILRILRMERMLCALPFGVSLLAVAQR
jgi:SAM-dependent methyltransferase